MPNIVHFCDDSRPFPRPILDSIIKKTLVCLNFKNELNDIVFSRKKITKKKSFIQNYLLGEIAQHMPDEQNDQSFYW